MTHLPSNLQSRQIGKFTNVAFTIFANRPFAMLSTLMQKLLYTRRFSYLNPFRKSEILELGKGLMIAHFYDMFAVRKFVPQIPFLRPVLVTLLSMTITINNSNYKLTKKKRFIEHHRVVL